MWSPRRLLILENLCVFCQIIIRAYQVTAVGLPEYNTNTDSSNMLTFRLLQIHDNLESHEDHVIRLKTPTATK